MCVIRKFRSQHSRFEAGKVSGSLKKERESIFIEQKEAKLTMYNEEGECKRSGVCAILVASMTATNA